MDWRCGSYDRAPILWVWKWVQIPVSPAAHTHKKRSLVSKKTWEGIKITSKNNYIIIQTNPECSNIISMVHKPFTLNRMTKNQNN
jgi:hypothetical protein